MRLQLITVSDWDVGDKMKPITTNSNDAVPELLAAGVSTIAWQMAERFVTDGANEPGPLHPGLLNEWIWARSNRCAVDRSYLLRHARSGS